MEIKVNYCFNEKFIPPRCRKARTRQVKDSCLIDIPVVSPAEAPVAMKHPAHIKTKEDSSVPGLYYNTKKEYRFFGGHLYARIAAAEKRCNAVGWWNLSGLKREAATKYSWDAMRDYECYNRHLHTREECEANLRRIYSNYLLLKRSSGIQVWAKVGEPLYEVFTMGLGHNHAGTGVIIQNGYNPNVAKECYFNANQYEECVREAIRVALARGDTNSVKGIKHAMKIQVLIPDAVKRNPVAEAGNGDEFSRMLAGLTAASSSASEAAALVTVATAMTIKTTKE